MLDDLSILNKSVGQLLKECFRLKLCNRKYAHNKHIYFGQWFYNFFFTFSTKNVCRSEFSPCFQAGLIPDRKLSMKRNYFPITGFSLE